MEFRKKKRVARRSKQAKTKLSSSADVSRQSSNLDYVSFLKQVNQGQKVRLKKTQDKIKETLDKIRFNHTGRDSDHLMGGVKLKVMSGENIKEFFKAHSEAVENSKKKQLE
jgi:hypothetical protein